ncbi:unnamed protein product [Rotaria sordida]|uniref:Uncharacterized protein n=1 Tax=Rotaria sordida TaxID=392033 RepID=A0A815CAA1_9BILA|nr:unnamed protein product [Rotaria sordida]CAF3623189.1 unnamed protein product [Rotaria sordida]
MGNRVYYHIYSDTSPSNITSLVFTKAGDYVRRFFPQQRLFEPTMVITGTWYRVGAYDRQTDRLNTFQIVLATDSDRSFVFLLYHDLQWAGPAYTTTPYAQAGFNAGDGIAFEMLPYSRTKDIVRLPEPSAWNGGILPCPMTRTQAIAAGRCCYESDSQYYRSNPNSNNCWLHQARPGHNENSAVECYVSKSSNIHGAGAECCYDFEGQLITRGTGAGTDDRYRSFVLPVQHFFEDTLPYLQCCMISTDVEMRNIYMYYRPPRRGSNTMGQSGGTWGDPHFITLDGTSYTFNGYGEYTYLAISNDQLPPGAFQSSNRAHVFMSQIRTMPLESNDVTVTRGFAARSSDPESQPISITVSRRENLIMRRGNELLEFEDNIHMLFFPEMTIERNPIDSTILTLSWTIGVTVQIKLVETTSLSVALVLNVAASIADTFRERTYGLLGIYDNEPNNDLRAQNGIVVNSNALLEQIHRQFGVTWAIDPDTSLFYYESGQSAEFFENQNRLFVPSFTEPINTAAEDASFRRTCKIDANSSSSSSWNTAQRTCYYDMSITRDETFAQTSFDAGDEILAIKADLRNPPLFNVELPVSMKSKHGEQIHLIIDATSNYSMSVIVLSADHLPRDATFNTQTKVFQWTAIEGEDYVRIRAKDSTYNLTSTHDIVFQVKQADESSSIQSEMQSSLFFLAILFCMLFK